MVKVKILSRSPMQFEKKAPGEIHKQRRNLDPKLHPFQRQVEYTRALNAVKLERLFAQPFVCAMSEHVDTVQCIAKHPLAISKVVTADMAGDIRLWDIPRRQVLLHFQRAHKGGVTGAQFMPDGSSFLTCSHDQSVKLWRAGTTPQPPSAEFLGDHKFSAVSIHSVQSQFATAGSDLLLWDLNRTRPIHKFNWGDDTVTTCLHNRSEPDMLLMCMSDRAVCLYDTRTQSAMQKLYLSNRTNCVAWNPMRPMDFACGNEDYGLYVFDVRKFTRPKSVLRAHVGPILSLDYAPTGDEIVTGSFDKSVRLWDLKETFSYSRDMYVTKRMQRVWSCVWTADNNFVLSGSEDTNLRVWKAHASKPLKKLNPKEARALDYSAKLKDRYKEFPEIKKIHRRRKVPVTLRKLQRKTKIMDVAQKGRDARMVASGDKKVDRRKKQTAVLATEE